MNADDISVVIEHLVGPLSQPQALALAAAVERELTRLADEGRVQLPAQATVDLTTIRVAGAALQAQRTSDPATLGTVLGRLLADSIAGSGRG